MSRCPEWLNGGGAVVDFRGKLILRDIRRCPGRFEGLDPHIDIHQPIRSGKNNRINTLLSSRMGILSN
ncbi:hypothetical protein [Micromonospora sp. LOL_021]|uniref:hypothetical protein n=1 Tax=Micromonospora sp. LOL_021 TaxID=3345417 RepID=UPI003A8A75D9